MVRSGDLDFVLLQPSTSSSGDLPYHRLDTVPNNRRRHRRHGTQPSCLDWPVDPLRAGLFLVLFACSLGMAYSSC